MNKMMLISREQPISVCNALHAARYPCVSGQRNASFRLLSAVYSAVRTASERVYFRTDPSLATLPTPSHVPHNLRGAVENT